MNTKQSSEKKIRIFSTPICIYCNSLKKFLKERNIEFEDVNVLGDREAFKEMVERSGQVGVPVIDINGQIVVGFNREKISNLLNIKD